MKPHLIFDGKRLKLFDVPHGSLGGFSKGEREIWISKGAFGSGEHETTAMCLRLLEEYTLEGLKALDLGTGTGILAIAALCLGCEKVVAVDPSPEAMETCERNARLNGVEDRVTTLLGTLEQVDGNSRFGLIMANLYGHLLEGLILPLSSMLQPDGVMVLSGMLYGEDFSICRQAERSGMVVERRLGGEEYLAMAMRRLG